MTEQTQTASPAPREVRVKPNRYQLKKAEFEEVVRIDATPDELALAVKRECDFGI